MQIQKWACIMKELREMKLHFKKTVEKEFFFLKKKSAAWGRAGAGAAGRGAREGGRADRAGRL